MGERMLDDEYVSGKFESTEEEMEIPRRETRTQQRGSMCIARQAGVMSLTRRVSAQALL